jgi:hypothetical protein
MPSQIFQTDEYLALAKRTRTFLNAHDDFLTASTARSPRAVGDAIQDILSENFEKLLGKHCAEYSADFARRAMADLAFTDKNGNYHVVDVKTHREDTKFNMPNLTSVERLARFYENDTNYFVLLLIKYRLDGVKVVVTHVDFVPIEFLDWECLTIGALGWGQIQIANSNRILLRPGFSRKNWMLELCDVMLEFYPKEVGKIQLRIEYFEKVKTRWENKPEYF